MGPLTSSGDRAYGKYQVMGANVGPWTKEALGTEMKPEEFVANPQAQDAVFSHKFGQYVEKYGNPQDAASVWFTGKPLAQGADRKDILGTTGSAYVDKFNRAMGAYPWSPPQAAAVTQNAPSVSPPVAAPAMPVPQQAAFTGLPAATGPVGSVPLTTASFLNPPPPMQSLPFPMLRRPARSF